MTIVSLVFSVISLCVSIAAVGFSLWVYFDERRAT